MGEYVATLALISAVFIVAFMACTLALAGHRRSLLAAIDQRLDDPDISTRIVQLRAAFNLCELQLQRQFEVSKRRLAEIHQLQAEVRALKFEREAREAGASDG